MISRVTTLLMQISFLKTKSYKTYKEIEKYGPIYKKKTQKPSLEKTDCRSTRKRL